MALTPQDIVRKEFREAFRGYNQSDVDLFLDEVVEEFSRLHEENQRLRAKAGQLQQEVARIRGPGAAGGETRPLEAEIRSRLRRFFEEQIRLLEEPVSPVLERMRRDLRPEELEREQRSQERVPGVPGDAGAQPVPPRPAPPPSTGQPGTADRPPEPRRPPAPPRPPTAPPRPAVQPRPAVPPDPGGASLRPAPLPPRRGGGPESGGGPGETSDPVPRERDRDRDPVWGEDRGPSAPPP